MHYEDLELINIKHEETGWNGVFISQKYGNFSYLLADHNVTEDILSQHNIVVGRKFLGVIANERLVSLEGFSFIEEPIKKVK